GTRWHTILSCVLPFNSLGTPLALQAHMNRWLQPFFAAICLASACQRDRSSTEQSTASHSKDAGVASSGGTGVSGAGGHAATTNAEASGQAGMPARDGGTGRELGGSGGATGGGRSGGSSGVQGGAGGMSGAGAGAAGTNAGAGAGAGTSGGTGGSTHCPGAT